MPIAFYWLLENKVSLLAFSGEVTLDELQEGNSIGIALMETSPETLLVHSIHDASNITSFPNNLKAVMDVTRTSREHPQMGWSVSVGLVDPITRFVVTMVEKVTRSRQRYTDTLEEALTFLNQVDATLPNLHTIDRRSLMLVQRIDHTQHTNPIPKNSP
jgi:hypothetical protein